MYIFGLGSSPFLSVRFQIGVKNPKYVYLANSLIFFIEFFGKMARSYRLRALLNGRAIVAPVRDVSTLHRICLWLGTTGPQFVRVLLSYAMNCHRGRLPLRLVALVATASFVCLNVQRHAPTLSFTRPRVTTCDGAVIGLVRGRKWYLHGDDLVTQSIMATHDFEATLGSFIRHSLSVHRGIFVDIGANVGIMTMSALELGRRVVAVEALPSNARLLRCSVALNGYSRLLKLHTVPLSAPNREHEKYCVCRPIGNPSDGILVPESQISSHPLCSHKKCESMVKSSTIDQLNIADSVGLMKIDVEGFECSILSGAEELLRSSKKPCVIVAEFNPTLQNRNGCPIHHMIRFMASWNYHPFNFDHTRGTCALAKLTEEEVDAMDVPGSLHDICWKPGSDSLPEHCGA